MAAFEDDTGPDLDQFVGKQWEEWSSAISSTKKSPSLAPKPAHSKEVSKLKRTDMKLFGHHPSCDNFFVVLCDFCGQPVKPQALKSHIEKWHKSKKVIAKIKSKNLKSNLKNHSVQYSHQSAAENDKTQKSLMSCGHSKNNNILILSTHKQAVDKTSVSSYKSSKTIDSSNHPNNFKTSITIKHDDEKFKKNIFTSLSETADSFNLHSTQDENKRHHSKGSKDVAKMLKQEQITSVKNSESNKHSKKSSYQPAHHNHFVKSESVPTSESTHKRLQTASEKSAKKRTITESLPVNIVHKSPTGNKDVTTSSMPSFTLPKKKNIPLKDRLYDPNKHCGVRLRMGDAYVQCTRSLTCKNHTLSAKRNVAGRKKPYDQLLSEHSAKNKLKAVTTPPPVEIDPKPPATACPPPLSAPGQFLAPTPPPLPNMKIRTNSAKVKPIVVSSSSPTAATSTHHSIKHTVSLIPKFFSPWHVDCWDSDSEVVEEHPKPITNIPLILHHPSPLTLRVNNGFVSRSIPQQYIQKMEQNEKICKKSSSNKTIVSIQPKFTTVSNASYTINHINHATQCPSIHCSAPDGLFEDHPISEPSITLPPATYTSNVKTTTNHLLDYKSTTDAKLPSMQAPNDLQFINAIDKRTKVKPVKRKASAGEIQPRIKMNVPVQNSVVRNRSKSVNVNKLNNNHEVNAVSSNDINATVWKNILSSAKITPQQNRVSDSGNHVPSSLISTNKAMGSYTVINTGTTISDNAMHISQSNTGTPNAIKRNAKGQFVEKLKRTNHIAINCSKSNNLETVTSVNNDEGIRINGLSMNWRPSLSVSNANATDLTQDDLENIIQQTV